MQTVKPKKKNTYNLKLMDACYDDTYLFSKHTTMTCGNFLYLIGMIWPDNDMYHKII